jgi:hypothetical protein
LKSSPHSRFSSTFGHTCPEREHLYEIHIFQSLSENYYLYRFISFVQYETHQALDALTAGIQWKRVNWVLDADIRGLRSTGRGLAQEQLAQPILIETDNDFQLF